MKREIKFRAWDTVNKEMYPPEEIIHLTGNTTEELINTNSCLILMQYTGLLDRNGKEIYEGDIVKAKWYDNQHLPPSFDVIGVVEFKECGFQVTPQKHKYDAWNIWLKNAGAVMHQEIIGNIYENPELL